MSYEDMKVEELREQAERRNLDSSGRKDDLVARLELADAEGAQSQSQDSVSDAAQASVSDQVAGTAPPTSTVQTKAVNSGQAGLPAQMQPKNQDESVKGYTVDERGNRYPAPE